MKVHFDFTQEAQLSTDGTHWKIVLYSSNPTHGARISTTVFIWGPRMIGTKVALNGAATTFLLASLVSGPAQAGESVAAVQPIAVRQFRSDFIAVSDPESIRPLAWTAAVGDANSEWDMGVLTQQDLDLLQALSGQLAGNDDGVNYGSLFANDEL